MALAIRSKVPAEMRDSLTRPIVAVEEIKTALVSIKGDRPLGLMGLIQPLIRRIGMLWVLIWLGVFPIQHFFAN